MLKKSFILIVLILIFDQFVKFYIKTHFMLGEEIHVLGNWFIIHFTENNGMAFGLEFGGNNGKIVLTLFRILTVGVIGYLIYDFIRKSAPKFLIYGLSAVFAGAMGNIIDSTFYGMWFSDSMNQVASFMPATGSGLGIFQGKVVDMLYFPVIQGHYPTWFPFWGGQELIFFRPVFNVADTFITVGVFALIVYYQFIQPKQLIEQHENVKSEISLVESEKTIEQNIQN